MISVDYTQELPLVEGKPTSAAIDEVVSRPLDSKPGKLWKVLIAITASLTLFGAICLDSQDSTHEDGK